MPSNKAAYLLTAKEPSLEVKDAPYPSPSSGEVLIQIAAVAINPLEKNIQDYNPPLGGKALQYPLIMGSDVAGTIIELGPDVTTRHKGQRVILNAHGISTGRSAHSGFQLFCLSGAQHTIPIPDAIPFEQAVVLPLGCDTAAAGLFAEAGSGLGLSLAKLGGAKIAHSPPASGSAVLIWGGSSSVGCCAIQLAHAAGYEVYATASSRNHDLCKGLGATKVFDHTQAAVEDEIVAALAGKTVVGALDCIANKEKTMMACARILAQAGGERKLLTVLRPPEEELVEGVKGIRVFIPYFVPTEGYTIVRSWMAEALKDGKLQCKPDAKVVGHGLEKIQDGINLLRQGVSATKLVVTIGEESKI